MLRGRRNARTRNQVLTGGPSARRRELPRDATVLCWKNSRNPKEKCVHLGCQTWPMVPLSFCHKGPGEKPELFTGSDSGTSFHTQRCLLGFLAPTDNGCFLWWKYCCKLCYWKLVPPARYSTAQLRYFSSAFHLWGGIAVIPRGSPLSEPDREQQCFTHLSDSFLVCFWLHTVSSALFDGSMFVTPPFPACPLTKLHSTNFLVLQSLMCFLCFVSNKPVIFSLFPFLS